MKLSIVSTLYKSAPHIDKFIERVTLTAEKITLDYELILVNDGSPDDSLQKALSIQPQFYASQNNLIKLLTLQKKWREALTLTDSFIKKAAEFLEVALSQELVDKLEPERIENLENNKKWIGNKWAGSDTLPGRYKRELKPETIAILNEKLEPVLRKMAKYDPDYAHLYLEGLDD